MVLFRNSNRLIILFHCGWYIPRYNTGDLLVAANKPVSLTGQYFVT